MARDPPNLRNHALRSYRRLIDSSAPRVSPSEHPLTLRAPRHIGVWFTVIIASTKSPWRYTLLKFPPTPRALVVIDDGVSTFDTLAARTVAGSQMTSRVQFTKSSLLSASRLAPITATHSQSSFWVSAIVHQLPTKSDDCPCWTDPCRVTRPQGAGPSSAHDTWTRIPSTIRVGSVGPILSRHAPHCALTPVVSVGPSFPRGGGGSSPPPPPPPPNRIVGVGAGCPCGV